MSIEDHVLALIEEGNPIPDPDQIKDVPDEPAAYLATLDQRSSEMREQDARVETSDGIKKWIWAAAVALVVIAGSTAVLTRGEEPPVATDPPPTTITNAANLIGSWVHVHAARHAESGAIVRAVFETDTYAFVIDDLLVDHGTYTADPNSGEIEFVSADDSAGCEPGATGGGSFQVTEEAVVLASGLDESCYVRAFFMDSASDVFTFGETQSIMVPTDPIDVDAMTTELDVDGYWGTDSRGVVLVDGRYTLINGGTVDTGTYEYTTGPFQIALTSDDPERPCANAVYNVALIDGGELFAERRGVCNPLGEVTLAGLLPSEPFEIPEPFAGQVPEFAGNWHSEAWVESSADGEAVNVVFWNNTYLIMDRDGKFDSGTYAIDEDLGLVTMTSDSQSNACEEGATHSSTYELDAGTSLTLVGDADACLARMDLLAEAMPLTYRN